MNIRITHFPLVDRRQISVWLNEHNLTGEAAEIGVAYGGYARSILEVWKGRRYHLVDPFCRQPKDVYRERTEDVDFDRYYTDCCALAREDQRVRIIRKFSVDGAKEIADDSLDWVFIDGNHSLEAVLADMTAWWPKVKEGGVFSGHDYGDDTNWPNYCQVQSAVDGWMAEHGLKFDTCADSWWHWKGHQ